MDTLNVADSDVLKRSITEIRKLKNRLEELEVSLSESIAVVGIGCYFPGSSNNPNKFWELLASGKDGICHPPLQRWKAGISGCHNVDSALFKGGYLDYDPTHFDPIYFEIPPKEANLIDPQQRLFLEVVWQALIHAGYTPEAIKGSRTGVFCGITGSDYLQQIVKDIPADQFDIYLTTGNCANFGPGRVSYLLDLKGPSVALDTACSSSLVSVHTACEALRHGECEMAIAGGVNLILSPDISLSLASGNMLADDGRCKTFDDSANGYGRGEGCGVVVLKTERQAREANDRILALIRSSSVQHDGKKSGITVPYSMSQKSLLRTTLNKINLNPHDVAYVEAHGTGTSLGDPIELEALQEVYGMGRSKDKPLYVGSVKSNIGHLEAASGIAGLIKAILAISNEKIPANLNFRNPNKRFEWDRHNLKVVTSLMDWPDNTTRIACVSSFGASGTNAHMILENSTSANAKKAMDIEAPLVHFEKIPCWYKKIPIVGMTDSSYAEREFSGDACERVIGSSCNDQKLFSNTLYTCTYNFNLSVNAVKTIRQHKIFGKIVLTGSIYLELAVKVMMDHMGLDTISNLRFGNITLLKPIVFPDGVAPLRLVVEKTNRNFQSSKYRINMYPGDDLSADNEDMYSSVEIEYKDTQDALPERINVKELIEKCNQSLRKNEFYDMFWDNLFTIGDDFKICDAVWRRDGELAIGVANPKKFFSQNDAHHINRDSFTAYLLGLVFKVALPESTLKYHKDIGLAFVGTGYDSCVFYRPLNIEEVYTILEVTYANATKTKFNGNATMTDAEGNVLCRMENIAFCTATPESLPEVREKQNDLNALTDIQETDLSDHPILGRKTQYLTESACINNLCYKTYPLIGDHTTFEYALFPALGYIHLASSYLNNLHSSFRFASISNLVIHQPIMLRIADNYPVQTKVKKKENGTYKFEISCYVDKKTVKNDEWILSCSADITNRQISDKPNDIFDKSQLLEFTQKYTTEEFFDYFWSKEFILGQSYHHISTVWRKPYQAIGLISSFKDTEHKIGVPDMPANFLQIYMALPLAMATVPDEYIIGVRERNATCIAAKVENFTIYDDNGGAEYSELWSLAELRDKTNIEDRWVSDFKYYDKEGRLVAKVTGVIFQIMKKEAVDLLRESLEEVKNQLEGAESVSFLESDVKHGVAKLTEEISGLDSKYLSSDINLGALLDSIMALQLRSQIEAKFSVLLPLNVIGECENLEQLVSEVSHRMGETH